MDLDFRFQTSILSNAPLIWLVILTRISVYILGPCFICYILFWERYLSVKVHQSFWKLHLHLYVHNFSSKFVWSIWDLDILARSMRKYDVIFVGRLMLYLSVFNPYRHLVSKAMHSQLQQRPWLQHRNLVLSLPQLIMAAIIEPWKHRRSILLAVVHQFRFLAM